MQKRSPTQNSLKTVFTENEFASKIDGPGRRSERKLTISLTKLRPKIKSKAASKIGKFRVELKSWRWCCDWKLLGLHLQASISADFLMIRSFLIALLRRSPFRKPFSSKMIWQIDKSARKGAFRYQHQPLSFTFSVTRSRVGSFVPWKIPRTCWLVGFKKVPKVDEKQFSFLLKRRTICREGKHPRSSFINFPSHPANKCALNKQINSKKQQRSLFLVALDRRCKSD